jgi:restriction endonuclease S subunit
MIVKLTEIVDIKTGITFRNRLLDNLDGEIEVIQMKDVDENCRISARLMRISGDLIKPRHLLQPGQIILLAKGKATRACLIRESGRKQVISSAFFSIRVKPGQKVLPEYLQWYLNLPKAEAYFQAQASGTSMFSLPMSVLKNLEVPLPPVEVQEQIIEISKMRHQEKTTIRELEAKRDLYIRELLIQRISSF